MLNDKEVHINAKGLIEQGLRNKQDGLVFFGSHEKDHDEIVNDFILNYTGSNKDIPKVIQTQTTKETNTEIKIKKDQEKISRNSLFIVYYRRDNEKYYFKPLDMSEHSYCFINLTFDYVSCV